MKKYPIDELNNYISQLARVPLLVTDLHKGEIHRARPINENDTITSKSDLSYKPAVLNRTYQRASCPNMTMFYGAIVPPRIEDDVFLSRGTSAMEAVPFLREPKLDGVQRLLYSKWIVKSQISLITILFTRYRNAKNPWLRNKSKHFFDYIENYPPHIKKIAKQANNFFSYEFSKPVGNNEDYKYLISALLTQKFIQAGYDGVIYPSVRSNGLGINIAIKPETVDQKLELKSVLDCRVHKKGKKVIVNNLGFCNVTPGSTNFKLEEITDPNFRFSDEYIENELK